MEAGKVFLGSWESISWKLEKHFLETGKAFLEAGKAKYKNQGVNVERLLMRDAICEKECLLQELNARINEKDLGLVYTKKKKASYVRGMTEEEFCRLAKESFKELMDKIRRYRRLENAIALTDGENEITLSDGRRFTRTTAEGLRWMLSTEGSLKAHPDLEARFFMQLDCLYAIRKSYEDEYEASKKKKIEQLGEAFLDIMDEQLLLGKELNEREQGLIRQLVEGCQNSVADPNHIMDWANQRKAKREKLLKELEAAISIYNATTYVEI